MQQRYSNPKPQATLSVPRPAPQAVPRAAHSTQSPQQQGMSTPEELTRIFNTALIATQTETKRDFSAELYQLTQSSSFKTILSAVRNLSRIQGISERQAAEEVIQTFRKMDEIWSQYLVREGVDRLRQPRR